jgi:hypothetical protein
MRWRFEGWRVLASSEPECNQPLPYRHARTQKYSTLVFTLIIDLTGILNNAVFIMPSVPGPRTVRMFLLEKNLIIPMQQIDVFTGENRAMSVPYL